MGFATTTLIFNTLLGVALATRYNVFALIPVAFIIMVATASVGAACGQQFSAIMLMLFLALVGLQAGYVAGSGLFILTPAKRLPGPFPSESSAVRSDFIS